MKRMKLLFTALTVAAMIFSGITCYASDASAEGGYAAVEGADASAEGDNAAFEAANASADGDYAAVEGVDASYDGGYAAFEAANASAEGGYAAVEGADARSEGGYVDENSDTVENRDPVTEGEKLDTSSVVEGNSANTDTPTTAPEGSASDAGSANTDTPTAAPEGSAGDAGSADTDTPTVGPVGSTSDAGSANTDTPTAAPDGNAGDTSSGNTDTEAEDTNPFAVVLDKLLEYGTEIICTLTLLGSLLLGYAYKRGLVPLVSSMLTTLRGAIGNAEKESAKRETDEGVKFSTLKNALDSIEERMNAVYERMEESSLRLAALAREGSATEAFRLILKEEVELLSDVFMSSSLPQYKKDAVGERLAAMKEELKKYEE